MTELVFYGMIEDVSTRAKCLSVDWRDKQNPENVQINESVTSEDSASTNIVNMASLLLIDLNPLKTKRKINNNSIL